MSRFTSGRFVRGSDARALQHGCAEAAGQSAMIVDWNSASGRGVVSSRPSTCDYQVGQIQWTAFDATSCTIQDLDMTPGTGANPHYETFSVFISPDGNQISIGGNGSFTLPGDGVVYMRCGAPGTPC